MERLFSKDTEKLFACNSLKLEEHASFSSARTTNRFPSSRCVNNPDCRPIGSILADGLPVPHFAL